MHGADFVAGGIAQISQIQPARGAFAPARRILDRRAASGNARVVQGLDRFRAVAGEADGAAVGTQVPFSVRRAPLLPKNS